MRAFIAKLKDRDDLVEIEKEEDVKFGVGAYIRKVSDTDGPAVLLKNIRGHSVPVLGGLFASRRRGLWAYEAQEEGALDTYLRALRNPHKPKLVSNGPCQEIIKKEESADVTVFPNPVYSELDVGPYITMGVTISKDPETGIRNAGLYRLQVKDKRRLGLWASAFQHVSVHLNKAENQNKPLEVAVALGVDPSVLLAAASKTPYGMDEYEVAGGLRMKPLELVKCKTVDLEVPSSSEIVIEGNVPPNVREEEGPFGEVTGYYGDGGQSPVIEISAITHRRDPIYLAGLTGMPTTDNHVLKGISYDATVYEELRRTFPDVRAVHFPSAGGTRNILFISMESRYEGETKAIISAALGLNSRPKLVVVVDPDINVYDPVKVLWAIAFHSQPAKDSVIIEGLPGFRLDPSIDDDGSSSALGIDATRPLGRKFPEMVNVPGVENIPDLNRLTRA